jgi:hypothetical protein
MDYRSLRESLVFLRKPKRRLTLPYKCLTIKKIITPDMTAIKIFNRMLAIVCGFLTFVLVMLILFPIGEDDN